MAEPSFDFNAFLNSASTAPSPDTAQQQHPTGAVHNRRGSNTADYGGHQLHEEDRGLLPAWATATERTNATPARHSSILDPSVPTQRRQEVIQQPQPEPQQQADQVNRAHAHATQQYRARIAEHHNRTMHPSAEAGSSQHKSSGRENAASQAAVGQSLSSSSVNDGKAGAPPAQSGRRSRESTLLNSKQFPPAAAPYGTAGPFTAAAVTPSTSRLSLQERRRFSQIASEATRSDSRSNPPNSNSSSSGNTHSQNQSESPLGPGDSAPGVNTAVTPKRNIKRAREAGRAAANAAADQDVQSNSYNGDISKSVSPGDGSEPAMTSLSPLSNSARSVLRSNEGENALPSDFDVSEALAKVATRKNPSIQLGPIGPSCAFTIADALHPNQPLIYVSETFTRLTGYEPADVLGKNCLFLQAPDGDVNNNSNPAGAKRRSSDGRAVAHMKKHLGQMRECQASLINYKKNGKAFINLVTMVPIPWGPDGDGKADSDIVRYFVGFQVDLAEQPGAVLSKDANGYVVDYTTSGGPDRQGGSTGPSAPPPPTLTASELFQEAREEKTRQVNGAHELADRVNTGEAGVRSWARFLLDNAHDLIYVLSLKGVFLYVSPSVERILGFKPEALIGHSIAEFCHPSDVVPVFRELKDSTSNASIASAARSSVDARGGYQAMTRGGAGQSGPQVNLLLRMRHRHLGHQWIESVGKLHLNQGKGRKVVISSGRPRAVYNLGWDQLRQTAVENPMGAPAPGPAFWVKVSLDGLVLSSKSRTAAVLGCTPAMLQGQHLMEMCNGEAVRAIGEALRSRGCVGRRGGEWNEEAGYRPIVLVAGIGVGWTTDECRYDIDAQQQQQQQCSLQQQQQQQQQQQYMQHHFPHHPGGSCSSGMGGFFAGRRERSPGYG
ncbi:unnamed protein product [Tilletia controversa]|uniref:PAS domain-containing protein n=2 Tax=Tilletia TaxID=13289 RepID=A0A8X7MU13_9BASI|nr:hypothetical protein CF336_g5099 [Tilletia laevis]KAE8247593.1 hypothetical protein A4X06_0g4337 [Tilletia controversa]KAE8260305.1 hypothetical protein A4X03_0g3852 [Tilletia caries]KAE8207278.1 hypothetical protein CF335_g1259 [Tilletia laevis]CAD6906759.1 unnamed protein product [Tilletia caries]